ncbi:hypothetical protein DSCO28_73700 (plasmid) [Desulfosarcina ovata subsp. sediminis]|uniref:NACHT domain-containing protein n=1 Tax=Desulfosarcina ovata subsp. sediminis TaxID=885957 RepID=A0A5K8A374_9BACT|nr:hypothetical protein [Desulfosarcina ovata]BBO86804.1 hypothetical protein DSCO28_73700 [Desulfosarcina ovata subsp. sediminis]
MNSIKKNAIIENKKELSAFSKSFKSEIQLIEALAELLRKMGRKGVQILHGPNEHGKDIIFYSKGGFGERRLYACVVKNSKLSGQMNSDSGVRTVFHQAETAFDTPFTTPKGHSEYVESVYVITPYECSPTAIAAIKSRLKSRSGQVTFLFGSELFSLFWEYWPDYIIFESGTLTKYLSDLPHSFSKDTALTALVRRFSLLSDNIKPLPHVYVQRGFKEILIEYYIEKVKWPLSNVLQKPIRINKVEEFIKNLQWHESFIKASTQNKEILCVFNDLYNDIGKIWKSRFEEYKKIIYDRRNKFEKKRRDEYEKLDKKYKKKYPFKLLSEADYSKTKNQQNVNYLKMETQSSVELVLDKDDYLTKKFEILRRQCKKKYNLVKSEFEIAMQFVSDSDDDDNNNIEPPPKSYREVQKIAQSIPTQINTQITSKCIPFLSNLLDSGLRAVLITGPAGFGKTCYCKWHALQDANNYLDNIRYVLPIYIQLHSIYPNKGDTFEKAFLSEKNLENILTEIDEGPQKNIRIYLDGLDEVPEPERRSEIMLLAWEAYAKNTNIQIVVTAREHISGPYLNWLRRFKLANLSREQVDLLVSNWLDKNNNKINDFNIQLNKLPSLKQIMCVPLLGTLIISVFKNTRSLPQNRVQLYELFVELHCGGWDLVKNIKRESKFGYNDKELVLSRLAGRLHYNKRRDGSTSDFKSCVDEIFPVMKKDWYELLDDVLQDGLLVLMGSRLMFSHLSFQEFLAAKYLTEPQGYRATSVLKMYLRGDEWWKDVLPFYVGMFSRPKDIIKWIKKNKNEIISGTDSKVKSNIEGRYVYLLKALEDSFPKSIDIMDI